MSIKQLTNMIPELKELSTDITMLRHFIRGIEANYETLEAIVEYEKADLIEGESMGFLDSKNYESVLNHKKAMYERIKAVKELVDVFKDTEKDIIQSELKDDCLIGE